LDTEADLARIASKADALLADPNPGAGILSVVEAAEDFALVWSNPDLVADYDRVAEKVVRAVRARSGNSSGKVGTK
jgi:hypothetical protein